MIDDPPHAVTIQHFVQQRMDLMGIAIEDRGPIQLGKAIAHQPALEALLANQLLGPLVLAEGAAAIEIRASRGRGHLFGVFDELIGVSGRDDVHEVGATHLEHVIDKPLQFVGGGQSQMTLEDHPIKAVQRANDETRKLGQKPPDCRPGILPRKGCCKNQPF